eukprot:TRINITY_DN14487_c0_g1_i1.p1 TRINITY_DN14487_c0_g1~~TRINITY_DN14487_c0_g1_i1.p1  ORF type:complete len:420 (-),score=105.84 TRINITY_DN14487_c0_g1_i1:467-1726(-)
MSILTKSYAIVLRSSRAFVRSIHDDALGQALKATVAEIQAAGTYKRERIITSAQSSGITLQTTGGKTLINFCANNYLGLANNPKLVNAAKKALDTHGLGLASVRFICGTQDIHKTLEKKIAQFHGTEDTILYGSAFDANGGLFETILSDQDAVISDELNHASIIDGVRLCKAQRFRFKHMDMADLEAQLKASASARVRLISTDGVFSMDGHIAPLDQICALARKYQAVVHVDECHATGFYGPTGRGTVEKFGVQKEVGIITSTIGKALGGSSGGFTTGRADVIEVLRQRSRPYLFSNTIAPPIVGAAIECMDMLLNSSELVQKLQRNTKQFREGMRKAGFDINDSDHPIVPVMLGDAKLASDFADAMLKEGIYVIGFSFPVVPKGKARIRVQVSAAHSSEQIDQAIGAFASVRKQLQGK